MEERKVLKVQENWMRGIIKALIGGYKFKHNSLPDAVVFPDIDEVDGVTIVFGKEKGVEDGNTRD